MGLRGLLSHSHTRRKASDHSKPGVQTHPLFRIGAPIGKESWLRCRSLLSDIVS